MIKNRPLCKVHKAERPPERCMICHSDTEAWYIDTGLDTTFDGTFYVGKCCMDKMVSQSPLHFNHEQVTRLLHENRVLKDIAVKEKEHAESELRRFTLRWERIKGLFYE